MISIPAAEQARFVMQTQQCLHSLSDRRALTPPKDHDERAIRWSGDGLSIITRAVSCSVGSHDIAVFFLFIIFIITFGFQPNSWEFFYPQRASGQAVVTDVYPSRPRCVPLFFVAHGVQHSHCSSIFIECS